MPYTYFLANLCLILIFFDIFMSYTYGFWVIYVLYLSRAAPLFYELFYNFYKIDNLFSYITKYIDMNEQIIKLEIVTGLFGT